MRHDYYKTLLNKKAMDIWNCLNAVQRTEHALKNTKLYKDYCEATKEETNWRKETQDFSKYMELWDNECEDWYWKD
jgi:hypothetical protein